MAARLWARALHQKAVYGLPELFPRADQNDEARRESGLLYDGGTLALVPALEKGYIEQTGIIANCASGVTGAGRKLAQNSHYPELNEGMSAYKVASHRHTPEIEQTLLENRGRPMRITFVPHLLPINRGILATCYARLKDGVTEEISARHMRSGTGASRSSGFCQRAGARIFLTSSTRISATCPSLWTSAPACLIAISAIDNMVKGAAGQAIQNMNILFGLDETTGLMQVPRHSSGRGGHGPRRSRGSRSASPRFAGAGNNRSKRARRRSCGKVAFGRALLGALRRRKKTEF